MLKIESRIDGDFEIHTASVEDRGDGPVFSCVAIYRKNWRDGWPALGGTRWVGRECSGLPIETAGREQAISIARELAKSMDMKNSLLRHAENALAASDRTRAERPNLFNWQGGKGVIWTPYDSGLSSEANHRLHLTPFRLMCHGQLVEHLKGEYIGSKDQGVGTTELAWIERATRYTIGMGCRMDTGEATAHGVVAGIRRAAIETRLATSESAPFSDLAVLVVGCGKVGLPVAKLLDAAGASVFVYDPQFERGTPESVYEATKNRGGAVDDSHLALLQRLFATDAVFRTEHEALGDKRIHIVSPNGGPTEWLSMTNPEMVGRTRASVIAQTRQHGGNVRLIVGGGNDQVTTTEAAAGVAARARALEALSIAEVTFVPDPAVSPGGVIAVSHEFMPTWDREAVNADAEAIVDCGTAALFAMARALGGINSIQLFKAFESVARDGHLRD